jgi:hypothetical protein
MSSNQTITQKTESSTISSVERVGDVMKDLEKRINPKSANEGLYNLSRDIVVGQNHESSTLSSMERGANEFTSRVGRPMTYAEMRGMWG